MRLPPFGGIATSPFRLVTPLVTPGITTDDETKSLSDARVSGVRITGPLDRELERRHGDVIQTAYLTAKEASMGPEVRGELGRLRVIDLLRETRRPSPRTGDEV